MKKTEKRWGVAERLRPENHFQREPPVEVRRSMHESV